MPDWLTGLFSRFAEPLLWIVMVVVVLLLIPPGRALVVFVLGQLWRLIEWLSGVIINAAQAWLVKILKAHMVVFRNLLPRISVLPSVAKDTVRKE